ncbi:IPT/TIG domain-containing protein [Streptomyces sp. NBC_01142]|uniref:IPT/TIG domain-containing protein n=1 Tax=Streptomyces sp. NBC_01142 TaxID=2975865 RepID=UPI00224E53D7|nr:IPT/TIG domain-containing protein [Streptomyces sp. NBC_01142]MCX4820468.1 IPT/TIG domain-containing protein [Streptomyces sp. NBC_01142]
MSATLQAPDLSVLAAPTVIALVPPTGPTTGGTFFTILGTNLTGATVTFGGIPATGVNVVAGVALTGVTPAHAAGNVPVVVTTPGGTATVTGGFTYIGPPIPAGPTVIALVPPAGPTTGGTFFTILGTNLTGATVTFDGIPATGVNVIAGSVLTGVTPAHAAGNVPVVVTTPAGSATVTGGFTYIAPPIPAGPTVIALVPPTGPTTGGTFFTILGTNLTGATVTFDGIPATGVNVIAGSVLTGVTPAHAAGNVPVVVTTPAGSATVTGGFTYIAPPIPAGPTVIVLVPPAGPTTGGTPFTILGTNLTGATVTFDGIPATGVNVIAGSVLTGVTPAHAAGNVPVVVTTPAGSATVTGGFTYIAPPIPAGPTVIALVPPAGPTTGGTLFTILGTNLTGATVTFDGIPATGVNVLAGVVLTGVIPAHAAGNVPVVVTTPAGSATVTGGFTYIAPPLPTAISITPATGPAVGGTVFVIVGANLTGATVTIGGVPATGIVVDPTGTVLAGITPAGAVGNAAVVVTTPAGSTTVTGGFTYV